MPFSEDSDDGYESGMGYRSDYVLCTICGGDGHQCPQSTAIAEYDPRGEGYQ